MNLHWFLNMIEDGDLCSSLFLLLVLYWIGGHVVNSRPELARWGWRGAVGVLVTYVAFRVFTDAPTTSDEMLWILLRGLLAAAFMTALTWILLPVCIAMWSATGGRFLAAARDSSRAAQKRVHEQQVAEQRRQEQLARTREFERSAPERERQQREAEARARVERDAAETASQRRENARSRVELFFSVNAPEVRNRFTREMLDDYLKRYMGDEKQPEVVEERAEALIGIIRQHLDKVVSPIRRMSFDEILAVFENRKLKIQESSLDPRDKEKLLIQLEDEREAAVTQAIRDGAL